MADDSSVRARSANAIGTSEPSSAPISEPPSAEPSTAVHTRPIHRRAALRRAGLLAALVLPAVVLLLGGLSHRWVGDDGFINVRVAQQLLAGNGLVFNAGERVEAFTSPAWLLLLALAGKLGLRVDDAAWSLPLVLAALGVLWSGLATSRLSASPPWQRGQAVPVGLVCYACLPPAWDYATSGLENGLGLAFLGASFWAVARCVAKEAPRARQLHAAAALLGFAPLVRPDYFLLSGPLLLLLCWRAPAWGSRVALVASGLAAGALYQIFRMGYYAGLVPNTALAKEAFDARWDQGLHYLWNGVGVYWLVVPVACVLLLLCLRAPSPGRGARWFALALVVSGVLHLVYVTRVGGDFMHGRMLLPGLFAIFSAVPLVVFEACSPRAVRWATGCICAVAGAWCVVCGVFLRVPAENEFGIGDEHTWFVQRARHANPTRLEHYAHMRFFQSARDARHRVAQRCKGGAGAAFRRPQGACAPALLTRAQDGTLDDIPDSALLPLDASSAPAGVDAIVAYPALGIAGGVLGLTVNLVDYYGLADPVGSRLSLTERHRPGHEKTFGTVWLGAKYAKPGSTKDGRVNAARSALGCGLLPELRHATTDPLDLERFSRNIALSFPLHRLRIPSEPYEARRELCGSQGPEDVE